jgi:hypothetical protein
VERLRNADSPNPKDSSLFLKDSGGAYESVPVPTDLQQQDLVFAVSVKWNCPRGGAKPAQKATQSPGLIQGILVARSSALILGHR